MFILASAESLLPLHASDASHNSYVETAQPLWAVLVSAKTAMIFYEMAIPISTDWVPCGTRGEERVAYLCLACLTAAAEVSKLSSFNK